MEALRPRGYTPLSSVIARDLAKVLAQHPEAFDCLVFKAIKGTEETLALNEDVVGTLESGARSLEYEPPVKGRAMIVYDEALTFGALGDGLAENFHSASQSINLVLSVDGVRTYSFVQWLEYPTAEAMEPQARTVYVLESLPAGRTLGVGMVYRCLPLAAMGEVPDIPEPDEGEEPPVGADAEPSFIATAGKDPVGVL